jgi:hypothetical protein
MVESFPGWQRMADRLVRVGWSILLVSVALALLGGVVTAAWNPDTEPPPPGTTECEDPPCFGGGGLPGPENLPMIVPFLGYGLALLLGVPSAVAGVWSLARGRWSEGFRRLLIFVGSLLFIVGMEIVPHVLNPCLAADLVSDDLPLFCERTESGPDITSRLHALDHALVGALPMALLYRWALHRWGLSRTLSGTYQTGKSSTIAARSSRFSIGGRCCEGLPMSRMRDFKSTSDQ